MYPSDQNDDCRMVPEISIVVPCYNVGRYLRECVESFEVDKHARLEVILVDDGSTDCTSELCDELAAEHACVSVIHRENGGSSAARNAGLARATGNWVWFVDSDDVISPYAIDYLLDVCHGSSADAIQFGLQMFNDGDIPNWQAPGLTDDCLCMSSEEWLRRAYFGNGQHYACSFLFQKKEQWNERDHDYRLFCEEFSLFEDVVSVERYMQGSKTILLSGARLYGYRQVDSSVTHRRSNSAADSGLRAVLEVASLPDAGAGSESKLRFEMDLLFVAYGLCERDGERAKALRSLIVNEIKRRARKVGLMRMGAARSLRYTLMKIGVLKCYYNFKYRGENA